MINRFVALAMKIRQYFQFELRNRWYLHLNLLLPLLQLYLLYLFLLVGLFDRTIQLFECFFVVREMRLGMLGLKRQFVII